MVKKILINLVILLVIFATLSIITDAFMPTFTNDMALGQLENDDIAYSTWRLWTYIPHVFNVIRLLTCIICGKNIYTAICMNKIEKELNI